MAAGAEGTGCSEGEVKRIGRTLLQGLDLMERLGYVHRDIKAQNLRDLQLTVLDQATGKPLPNVVVDPGTFTLGAGVVAEMLINLHR